MSTLTRNEQGEIVELVEIPINLAGIELEIHELEERLAELRAKKESILNID